MRFITELSVVLFFAFWGTRAVASEVAPGKSEFEGTWHVLVHYQDRASQVPERWHWEDRVWVIESEGAALRWRDYPIVVFKDEAGRFEKSRGGLQRTLQAWEPSAAQEREIHKGLQANDRGARSKRLEAVMNETPPIATENKKPQPTVSAPRSDTTALPADAPSRAPVASEAADGLPQAVQNDALLARARVRWASSSSAGTPSAMVVTYTEYWSIRENPETGLPVFVWTDALESGLGEGVEGSTLFFVEEKSADGAEYRGHYQKDGNLIGRFRMRRSGSISLLGG